MTEVEQKRGGANKYARLYALGPDKLQKIDVMLIKGETATEVGRVITEEWGFYADELDALIKQITRYRTEEITSKIGALAEVASNSHRGRSLVAMRTDQLDVMADQVDLIEVQKARINKAMGQELQMPLLLSTIKYELRLLMDMYKQYAALQLETGLLRRAPKVVSTSFHFDEETGMLAFEAEIRTNSEARKATKDIMEILEGEYKVVPNSDDRGKKLSHPE